MKNKYLIIRAIGILLFFLSLSCTKYSGVYDQKPKDIDKYDGSIYAFIEENSSHQFDSLLAVINRLPQFKNLLQSDSITFILATNKCFETAFENLNIIRKAQNKKLLYISTVDSAQLDTIFSRYLINSVFTTQKISPYNDGYMVYSLEHNIQMNLKYSVTNASGSVNIGPKVLVVSDTKETPYTQYWVSSNTIAVNFQCNNGVIHTISTSHEFGFGEVFTRFNK